MAKAAPSLSPKALERMRRYRSAIFVMAMYRAKQAVREQIRAQGLKVSQFSAKEITLQAEAYMAQHMEELINNATADVTRFPEFANIRSDAQTNTQPKSITSAVQMSGAK